MRRCGTRSVDIPGRTNGRNRLFEFTVIYGVTERLPRGGRRSTQDSRSCRYLEAPTFVAVRKLSSKSFTVHLFPQSPSICSISPLSSLNCTSNVSMTTERLRLRHLRMAMANYAGLHPDPNPTPSHCMGTPFSTYSSTTGKCSMKTSEILSSNFLTHPTIMKRTSFSLCSCSSALSLHLTQRTEDTPRHSIFSTISATIAIAYACWKILIPH